MKKFDGLRLFSPLKVRIGQLRGICVPAGRGCIVEVFSHMVSGSGVSIASMQDVERIIHFSIPARYRLLKYIGFIGTPLFSWCYLLEIRNNSTLLEN